MKEVAKTDQARFEWWLQTKFLVLPTDPRYMDLTEEQMDLMYEHFLLDNPPKKAAYNDDDYDKEEAKHESEGMGKPNTSSRLPIQDHERYDDPDFDAEWNAVDEVSDSEVISENPSKQTSGMNEETNEHDIKKDTEIQQTDEWEVL